jgi:hypothetical protein
MFPGQQGSYSSSKSIEILAEMLEAISEGKKNGA